MESILLFIAFLGMLVGSFTDIKTREVPDWINYSLIFMGLGLRLIFSVAFWNYNFIVEGLIGFALFAGLAFLMFYAGQWGGGDAKMLMGLGALIGFNLKLDHFLLWFLINLAIAGGVYGLLWSISLSIVKWKSFSKEFKKTFKTKNAVIVRRVALTVSALLLIPVFLIEDFWIKVAFFIVLFMTSTTHYLWVFVKAVENSTMFKLVSPEKLTEGDWIADEILTNRKMFLAKGKVSKKGLRKINNYNQKLYKKVRIFRKYLLLSLPQNCLITKLKLKDKIRDDVTFFGLNIHQNTVLTKNDLIKIEEKERANNLSEIKVINRILFFEFNLCLRPNELKEGHVLLNNIEKGYYITGPKDLGIEKHQIKKLIELKKQKKADKIMIKEGIPFVPSFLLGFIVTVIWGNLFLLLL